MIKPPAHYLLRGSPTPLGATVTPAGVNFAVFSAAATGMDLCLFDRDNGGELMRLPLPARSVDVWHGFLPGAGPGLVYGLRAHGLEDPHSGHRFAPTKLLLDPYARALSGHYRAGDAHLTGEHALADSAPDMVRAVVVDDHDFDWQDDRPPLTPLADTILYEVHVKGFSQQHPQVPAANRGTYAGLASDAAIAHFHRLGVTALSLLPVHHAVDEPALVRRGRVNYWGYNTLAFFAPSSRYARLDARLEFRQMVQRLHAAGLEVIIDVVYNHTAEGDAHGPTLSWRGLDNQAYYRLRREDPGQYENHTGCGNTLNLSHPRVLQMVMDSLRYWVVHMHVDGFRFDLAATLGRTGNGFDNQAPFFQAIAQDPILAGVKLIAEPWDIGPGGYRLGSFPGQWTEWNDRFRNAARTFWLSKPMDQGELPNCLIGSPDVFGRSRRGPLAGINYVCAHDGFTLADLVSYNAKHNLANGEDNRDGSNDNFSWNCGVEGASSLLAVNVLRLRLRRALLASLILARGIPMLGGGDEMSRTQLGSNNGYQEDSPIGWFDWTRPDEGLSAYIAGLIGLRRRYAQLRTERWLSDEPALVWLNREGEHVEPHQWGQNDRFAFGLRLADVCPTSQREPSPELLLLINGEARECSFVLSAGHWRERLDSARQDAFAGVDEPHKTGSTMLKPRSLVLMEFIQSGGEIS